MIIGIYGGSFDPIHSGHSMVANFISQCNVVDEVWITVSRRNPLKEHETFASDFHRLEMAKIVALNCKGVKVSSVEMELNVPSYTYDTLTELKKRFPEHEFRFIIGSDNLNYVKNWKNIDNLIKEFGFIVYPRPGFKLPETEPDGMTFLNGAPEFGMSSTLIRDYISSGWNINYFVPVEVAKYIHKHKLYHGQC